eukprot:1184798-Prorocentrum_minimum.AAC.1
MAPIARSAAPPPITAGVSSSISVTLRSSRRPPSCTRADCGSVRNADSTTWRIPADTVASRPFPWSVDRFASKFSPGTWMSSMEVCSLVTFTAMWSVADFKACPTPSCSRVRSSSTPSICASVDTDVHTSNAYVSASTVLRQLTPPPSRFARCTVMKPLRIASKLSKLSMPSHTASWIFVRFSVTHDSGRCYQKKFWLKKQREIIGLSMP